MKKPASLNRVKKLLSQMNAIVSQMSKQTALQRKEARLPAVLRNQTWRGMLESQQRAERAEKLLALSIQLVAAVTGLPRRA